MEYINPKTLDDAMLLVAKTIGPDAMADGSKLFSVFTDLAPQLKKERNMLRMFVDAGGAAKLYAVKDAGAAEKDAALKSVVRTLNETWSMDKTSAASICGAYLYALTGQKSAPAKKPATKKTDAAKQDKIPGKATDKSTKKADPIPAKQTTGKGPGFGLICFAIWLLMNLFLYLDIAAGIVIPVHILSGFGVFVSILVWAQNRKKK